MGAFDYDGWVNGYVKSESGSGIDQSNVSSNFQGPLAISLPSGAYIGPCIPGTNYYFTALKSGYCKRVVGPYSIGAGSTITVNFTCASYAALENYIQHLYLKILGRNAEAGAKTSRATSLMNMWTLARNHITELLSCGEYINRGRSNTEFVTDLYQSALFRSPDSGGLSGWVGYLDGGGSRGYVVNAFVTSSEFKSTMNGKGINP